MQLLENYFLSEVNTVKLIIQYMHRTRSLWDCNRFAFPARRKARLVLVKVLYDNVCSLQVEFQIEKRFQRVHQNFGFQKQWALRGWPEAEEQRLWWMLARRLSVWGRGGLNDQSHLQLLRYVEWRRDKMLTSSPTYGKAWGSNPTTKQYFCWIY